MECLSLRRGSSASGQERCAPPAGDMRPSLPPRFMCLKTMDGRGPDGEFVHPDHCSEARSCFETTLTTPSGDRN